MRRLSATLLIVLFAVALLGATCPKKRADGLPWAEPSIWAYVEPRPGPCTLPELTIEAGSPDHPEDVRRCVVTPGVCVKFPRMYLPRLRVGCGASPHPESWYLGAPVPGTRQCPDIEDPETGELHPALVVWHDCAVAVAP